MGTKPCSAHLMPMAFLLLAVCLSGGSAAAEEPSALIEDVSAPSTQLQPMDYLYEGDKFALAEGESITVSYLGSCAIERITGGVAKVSVGNEKSAVTGKGRVKRKFVECGGAGISLTRRQSDAAAGVVVRGGETPGEGQPEVTVYSLHPVLKLSEAASNVRLQRLDRKESQDIPASSTVVDFAKMGLKLAAGGVYRASAGPKSVVFKVANTARASQRNIISRLIEL